VTTKGAKDAKEWDGCEEWDGWVKHAMGATGLNRGGHGERGGFSPRRRDERGRWELRRARRARR
jgi:hypothetical protein